MKLMQRANVVLQVKDDAVERMLDKGFSVIDESGKVLQQAPAKDAVALAKLYKDEVEKNKRLEAEIQDLKQEIDQLKQKPKSEKASTEESTKKVKK